MTKDQARALYEQARGDARYYARQGWTDEARQAAKRCRFLIAAFSGNDLIPEPQHRPEWKRQWPFTK